MTGNLVFPTLPPGVGVVFSQRQGGAGGSGSATGVILPPPVPLYNPKITLVNGTGSFCFSEDDANKYLRVKASDSNPASDWTAAPYALAQVDIAIVSVNFPPEFQNARVLKSNCAYEAQVSGVLITTVLTGADIAALREYKFIALAKLTFVSGQIRIVGGVRIEKI